MPKRTKAKKGKAKPKAPARPARPGRPKKKFSPRPRPTRSRQAVARGFNRDMYKGLTVY